MGYDCSINQEVLDGIAAIRSDTTHGAGAISRKALDVIGSATRSSDATDTAAFVAEMQAVGQELMSARPSMAPLVVLVSRWLRSFSDKAARESNLASLKMFAYLYAQELISSARHASLMAARNAASMIVSGDNIMTCSYSSTICHTFAIAKRAGTLFEVKAIESLQDNAMAYGTMLAEELDLEGLLVRIIPDGEAESHIVEAKCVMIGADAVMDNGSIVNGVPSLRLAVLADRVSVPFYVVAETTKFLCIENYYGFQLEKGFDQIPANLISGIICDTGIINSRGVGSIANYVF